MARRTASVVIQREGRDRGDVFALTEMPADQATWWAIRCFQLLARSGTEVPPGIFAAGWAGFAAMGIGAVVTGLGKAPAADVKPLLDELLTCVTGLTKAGAQLPISQWQIVRTQIEEPATYFQLYEEVVSLHLGFSLIERLSYYRILVTGLMGALGPNTSTATESLPPSFPAASQS